MKLGTASWSWIFLHTLLLGRVLGAEFEPAISVTKAESVASQLLYFDDSATILALRDHQLYFSKDKGVKWEVNKDIGKDEKLIAIQMDSFDLSRAYVFTAGHKQYFTTDKGESWSSFEIKDLKKSRFEMGYPPKVLSNAANPSYAMIEYYQCEDLFFSEKCEHSFYFTKDGFKSDPQKLDIKAAACNFARSSSSFEAAKPETIYCVENNFNSFGHIVESNLVRSDDFFKTRKNLNNQYSKSGRLIEVRVEQNFLIAIVQNDKFNKRSKVTLLISKDGDNFLPADLKIDVAYGLMTFLESSPSSLFLSVAAYSSMFNQVALSTVYASDSSGLSFEKVLDNVQGSAFSKAQTIDGVWLANVVEDGKENNDEGKDKPLIDFLTGVGMNKDVKTQISFDDAKSWDTLVVLDDDNCKHESGCSLHLLTPSERDGAGNFVTGPTPAILMGVGNTGEKLDHDLDKMRTYVSRDGGVSWKLAIDEACLFSFGDLGNIIVAMPFHAKDDSSSKTLYYSLDQGLNWEKKELETAVFPLDLTTTIDGTGTAFLLSGMLDRTPDNQFDNEYSEVVYAVDFSDAFGGKKCKDSDFEEVYARKTVDDKKAICVYGHREKFKRRKSDAKCLAATLYEDITVFDEACHCSQHDFECAPGFKRNPKDATVCEPNKRLISDMCASKKVKQLKLPDKVLVAGNECSMNKKSLSDFVTEHTLKCSDYVDEDDKHHSTNKKIQTHRFEFEGSMREYTYFEQGENYNGENIIVRTTDNRLFASRDGGSEFVKVPIYETITAYFMGYVPGQIVLVSEGERIFISLDSGNTYTKYEAPTAPNPTSVAISFHKNDTDQLIWYGSDDYSSCTTDPYNKDCHIKSYITKDGAESFTALRDDVVKCDFVSPIFNKEKSNNDSMIFCSVVDKKKKQINLVSTTNDFKDEKVVAENIVGYAISGNFIVVGSVDKKKQTLTALVTEDGETFADAAVPHDLDVDIEQAFTILDSESGSMFMHVTTETKDNFEYGAILKSNSNGTNYALSLDHVNRNGLGFVDYDRIEGIEGILIANTVENYHDKKTKTKKLKTQISHNDGGEWNYLLPPSIDSKGKKFKCTGKTVKECSLNLHGFTERSDYRDTFSSSSAIGLMIGIGNVGPYLTDKKEGSTFLTRDGGITWKEIKKGVHMWEYGDRGSILVLVEDGKTNKVTYSLDEGDTWKDYKFTKEEVDIKDIATVPSDNSRKFLVFAEDKGNTVGFSLDFTDIYEKQCQLDLDNPNNDDFEYWSPKHPNMADNCLFGHEAKYLRRASGHNDCFIGSAPLTDGFKITRNCSCTRRDYECDYNYFRDNDNTCKLVKGLSPSDHKKEMCKNNVFQYFEPTGYRKIPLSTCEGGKKFDSFVPKPCPGKTSEFNKYYGREFGFFSFLLIIGFPIAIFVFVTWFVYDRGIRRNGGFKQFGQIRLDEDEFDFHPIENNQIDKAVNSVVKGGIFVAATLIASFKTLRKLDKVLFEKITSQLFRGRGSRRNYVNVPDLDEEEDELFGNFRDNYDEELQQGDTELHQNFQDDDNNKPSPSQSDLDVEESNNIDADARLFDIDDHSDGESRN